MSNMDELVKPRWEDVAKEEAEQKAKIKLEESKFKDKGIIAKIQNYFANKKMENQYKKYYEADRLKKELETVKLEANRIKTVNTYKKQIAHHKSYIASNKNNNIFTTNTKVKTSGLSTLISVPQQHDYGFNSFAPKKSKKSNNIFDF